MDHTLSHKRKNTYTHTHVIKILESLTALYMDISPSHFLHIYTKISTLLQEILTAPLHTLPIFSTQPPSSYHPQN